MTEPTHRCKPARGELRTGRDQLDATGEVLLERQGDYLVWGPGIDHTWRTDEDSTVLTVRRRRWRRGDNAALTLHRGGLDDRGSD